MDYIDCILLIDHRETHLSRLFSPKILPSGPNLRVIPGCSNLEKVSASVTERCTVNSLWKSFKIKDQSVGSKGYPRLSTRSDEIRAIQAQNLACWYSLTFHNVKNQSSI